MSEPPSEQSRALDDAAALLRGVLQSGMLPATVLGELAARDAVLDPEAVGSQALGELSCLTGSLLQLLVTFCDRRALAAMFLLGKAFSGPVGTGRGLVEWTCLHLARPPAAGGGGGGARFVRESALRFVPAPLRLLAAEKEAHTLDMPIVGPPLSFPGVEQLGRLQLKQRAFWDLFEAFQDRHWAAREWGQAMLSQPSATKKQNLAAGDGKREAAMSHVEALAHILREHQEDAPGVQFCLLPVRMAAAEMLAFALCAETRDAITDVLARLGGCHHLGWLLQRLRLLPDLETLGDIHDPDDPNDDNFNDFFPANDGGVGPHTSQLQQRRARFMFFARALGGVVSLSCALVDALHDDEASAAQRRPLVEELVLMLNHDFVRHQFLVAEDYSPSWLSSLQPAAEEALAWLGTNVGHGLAVQLCAWLDAFEPWHCAALRAALVDSPFLETCRRKLLTIPNGSPAASLSMAGRTSGVRLLLKLMQGPRGDEVKATFLGFDQTNAWNDVSKIEEFVEHALDNGDDDDWYAPMPLVLEVLLQLATDHPATQRQLAAAADPLNHAQPTVVQCFVSKLLLAQDTMSAFEPGARLWECLSQAFPAEMTQQEEALKQKVGWDESKGNEQLGDAASLALRIRNALGMKYLPREMAALLPPRAATPCFIFKKKRKRE